MIFGLVFAWMDFRLNLFLHELIFKKLLFGHFSWICFHELLILGIVSRFVFANW